MITNKTNSCIITHELLVRIKIINLPENTPVMSSGFKCVFHLHTAKENIKVKKIRGKYNDEE